MVIAHLKTTGFKQFVKITICKLHFDILHSALLQGLFFFFVQHVKKHLLVLKS